MKGFATRRRVPSILQSEPNEAGAAALAMVLGAHGRFVSMEEMCRVCGVGRDGVQPEVLLRAAAEYSCRAELRGLAAAEALALKPPLIALMESGRYLVVERVGRNRLLCHDPETGRRPLSRTDFVRLYDGRVMTVVPNPAFQRAGRPWRFAAALGSRLSGVRTALVYVILAGLFLVLPGLALPTFSKIFVDDILVGGLEQWFPPLLLAMGLTAFLHGALNWLQKHYLLRLETRLALSLSARFFDHVFRLPIAFFHHRYGGEIVNRVMINDSVAQLLSRELAVSVLATLMIVFYALLMLQYDPWLTLAGIAVVAANLAVLRLFSRRRTDLVHQLLQDQGKSLATAMSGLQLIETLKACGAESEFFAQWVGHQTRVKNAEQTLGVASQALAAVPPLLTGLNNVLVLAFGALRIIEGQLSVGGLVAFQSLMFSFVGPFNQLVGLGARLQELKSGIVRLDDVLAAPPDPGLAPEPHSAATLAVEPGAAVPGAGKLSGDLELIDMTFGYNPMEPPLIEGFSLHLRPGERVALVGRSGSGKSTVAKLITGLYRPWSGTIRFDGRPADSWPRELRSRSIALVDQDISMFEGTVRDNLTLWDDTVSPADLIQAALDACIHEDIAERPGGYDSPVAEGCRNFSGGQRQRLEIARALVQRPSILVLDEATSALDAETEKQVDDNLRRRGCTCLIVAHRLSTIRDCDEIIVMEHGKVVERGTHEGMKQAGGPYAALIAAE